MNPLSFTELALNLIEKCACMWWGGGGIKVMVKLPGTKKCLQILDVETFHDKKLIVKLMTEYSKTHRTLRNEYSGILSRKFSLFWRNCFLGNIPANILSNWGNYFLRLFDTSNFNNRGLLELSIKQLWNTCIYLQRKKIMYSRWFELTISGVEIQNSSSHTINSSSRYDSKDILVNSIACLYFYLVDCKFIDAVIILARLN